MVLKDKVYNALKDAITEMDIYGETESPRLDERSLAEKLGVSRTPVREALSRLEQEGLVETVARRGAFVVRKSKAEILEMIHVWAALEGMAARLATQKATDGEIRQLHEFVDSYSDSSEARADIDEYSETNIRFHQHKECHDTRRRCDQSGQNIDHSEPNELPKHCGRRHRE